MILGPPHGHPVQLDLMHEGDSPAQQGQLTVINNRKGQKDKDNNSSLEQSWVASLLIMFVDWHLTLKISVLSFYPGHNIPSATYINNCAHIHFDFARESGPVSGLDGNDSDIETKAE